MKFAHTYSPRTKLYLGYFFHGVGPWIHVEQGLGKSSERNPSNIELAQNLFIADRFQGAPV